MPQAARPAQMMSMMDSVNKCLKFGYVDFGGRATRSEYWWFQLAIGIGMGAVMVGLAVVSAIIGGDLGATLFFAGYILAYLAILSPILAVTVRRLHDLGKSGWMLLIGMIPFVGSILLLVWFVSDGEPQDNQYGPVPTNKL
ncbi:MAG: DUF805 domain-containing protein [Candidatus Poseidoniaceae archaeon]|nr:DUF805 domain-containing protein [Candidatus Poseidoniaceae archaeon]